ncbi:hypothetical protein LINGRAHAP2_LOCUS16135 [Linum grandiflorum]
MFAYRGRAPVSLGQGSIRTGRSSFLITRLRLKGYSKCSRSNEGCFRNQFRYMHYHSRGDEWGY